MRLSEIVSKTSNTTLYTQLALVIFFAIFVGVIIYLWFLAKPEAIDRAAQMPLDDDNPQEPRTPPGEKAISAHQGEGK